MTEPCTARIKNHHNDEHCVLHAGHKDPEYGTDHAGPKHPVSGRLRWSDSAVGAVPHQPATEEPTDLDKSRRYLRPVHATIISDDPNGVHLSVYQWLPMFGEWVTGPGLCAESMRQGPLPEGTAVTCAKCLEWQPKYERILAPGYRPEDDDPEALRAKLERLRGEVLMLCECCGNNRERMARIKRELGIDEEVI